MAGKPQYDETGKTCAKCRVKKPLERFKRLKSGHPHSYCTECRNKDATRRRRADPESYRAANRKAHTAEYQKSRRDRTRAETYLHYGNCCSCCGEVGFLFLTLDHVNNDGKEHRAKYNGIPMWEVARREGYPDTLRILCYNCNCGRARNGGTCPHQKVGVFTSKIGV